MNRQMLNNTFKLTPEKRGKILLPPPPPPPGNIGDQPQIAQQLQAAHPPWLPIVVPDAVPGARREDVNFQPLPHETQFLGGRWSETVRRRRVFCPSRRSWSGRGRCESPSCGHRNVCNHHSVILCQSCFYSI